MELFSASKEATSYTAPGADKEIGVAVINALSRMLIVEIRRDGGIYRQEYRHGIPQIGLMKVGETTETGTSITFTPERELFTGGFDKAVIEARVWELTGKYPGLRIGLQ
jgi:DNA gyrase subunit B